jgi:lipid-A-disaccharide synthase
VIVPWRLDESPPAIPEVTFSPADGPQVLKDADFAIVAFGTACLEAALLGIPFLAVGSAHPLTQRLVRPLLRTEWLALPNILLARSAIPERVLPLEADAFERDLRNLHSRLPLARQESGALAEEIRAALGPGGFAQRAADCLEPLL